MGRELSARYRGSALGKTWLILQPLAFLAIYFVVFSQLFQQKLGPGFPSGTFALAMFCGLIPWISVSETISRGSTCVLENGNLVKKFAFPSELLPVYLTGVSLINAIIGFAMLVVGCLFIMDGHLPRLLWLFPIVLILQGMFTIGIVYLLCSVTVYIRDLAQVLPMLLTFWFFMSPIFMFAKSASTPPILQQVLRYNPATYLIALYREIFIWDGEKLERLKYLKGKKETVALPFTEPGAIPWIELGVFAACAVIALVVGLKVFHRLKPGFGDEV